MPAQNEVELTITVDDQGTKQLASIVKMLETLQKSVASTARSFTSIRKSVVNLNRSLSRTTSSTEKFDDRLSRMEKRLRNARQATDRAEASMVDYSQALDRVGQSLARVRDFGARQIVNFVQASSRLEDITRAYTSILGSAEQAAEAVARLREAAEAPGLTFEVAARATQRFLSFGVALDEAIQLTSNFANAAAVQGTTLHELDLGLQQVAKSIGAAKIEQEDLTSISERFGQVAQNIRREYGRTGEDVTNAIGKANQTITQFFSTVSDLSKQATADSDAFSNAVSNLGNAFNLFSTTIGDILKPAAREVIELLTNMLGWFNDLDPSVQKAIVVFGALVTALAAIGAAVAGAAAALGGLALVFGVPGAAAAGGGLVAAAGAGATAIGGFIASLAPLAVPVAAAVGSVAALVATFIKLNNTVEAQVARQGGLGKITEVTIKADEATKDFVATLKVTREEMDELVKAGRDVEGVIIAIDEAASKS